MRTSRFALAALAALAPPTVLAALAGACAALPAAAQQVVGRLPAQSTLRDLHDGQRFGAFAGWLTTGRDPVGIRAHSAPIAGVRYDLLMGSPAYLSLRLFGVKSEHDVVNPGAPATNRKAGTASANQLGADASVQVALTGERTWHGVQPLASMGLGFMAGVANHFDVGLYAPGASLMYTYGLGVRVPTGQNGDFRLDVGWLVHQVRYPQTYRTTTAADNIPVRAEGSLTPLTTNRAITASWTWGVFR